MALSVNYYNNLFRAEQSSMLLNSYNSTVSGARKNSSSYSSIFNNLSYLYGHNYAGEIDPGAQSYLTGLKSSAEGLNDLISSMQNGAGNKETVVSSDESSVSVSSTAVTNNIADVEIDVDQAASGQVNEGDYISSARKVYSSQNYKFEIESGGKRHQVSFGVSAGDTFEDMQKKMAKAINSSNIGIKASVEYDYDKNTSALKIESAKTGDSNANRFSIKDISGDAVRKTGTSQVTRDAQNALYRIDGGELKESESNVIDLGKGISATIKKATGDPVTIGMGKGKTVTYANVEDMVKKFNTILGNVSDNSADRGASRLMKQLGGASRAYSASLKRIGINVNSEGYMSINKDKLNESIANGSVEKFFTENKDTSYGFANRLEKITEDVRKNTTDYISKESLGGYFSSNNPSLDYLRNYRYNQIANSGLLFDMFL